MDAEPTGGGELTAAEREAAFREHVLPELDVLYRVARSLTRGGADAEDVVQDTLLRAYRSIHRFDGRYPRAWLLTILRNAHINRNRRRRPGLLSDPDETMRTLADTSERSGPEDVVVDATFDERVVDALDALPERFRTAVELVDLDGLSYEEAAATLEIPVGTVMSRLHRGRERMRDRLVAHGIRPPTEAP